MRVRARSPCHHRRPGRRTGSPHQGAVQYQAGRERGTK